MSAGKNSVPFREEVRECTLVFESLTAPFGPLSNTATVSSAGSPQGTVDASATAVLQSAAPIPATGAVTIGLMILAVMLTGLAAWRK